MVAGFNNEKLFSKNFLLLKLSSKRKTMFIKDIEIVKAKITFNTWRDLNCRRRPT